MTFHRLKDFTPGPGEFVCRHSGVPSAIIAACVGAMIVASWVFSVPPYWWWQAALTFFLGLFAVVFFTSCRRSLGRQNWLLVYDGKRLAIKFRSYLNAHFDENEQVVVTIDRREIAWFRRTRETLTRRTDDTETETTWLRFLDIGLADGVDTRELAERLAEERRNMGPGTWHRSRFNDYPLRVIENGKVLRVAWTSQNAAVRPSLKKTLIRLSSLAPVLPMGREKHNYANPAKTQAEQETQLLELLERGDTIAAVGLAKRAYKLSYTDAKKFVGELAGTRKP